MERYAYQTLFNGLSVQVATGDIAKLTRIPGVQNIYPVKTVHLNTVQSGTSGTPDQQDWLKMTGADYAQSQLGLRGDGIRLAVIDTGIDYSHPDLGGCFGAGCRVEMGYDFVGDAYNATNDPVPDPDPMDCYGHGTHVSGIAGADGHGLAGHVTGVRAACEVSCLPGRRLRGILHDRHRCGRAGEGVPRRHRHRQHVARERGRLGRIAPGGRERSAGAQGHRRRRVGRHSGALAYSASSPSTGRKVISVASFENLSVTLKSFTISPDDKAIGYVPAAAAPAPPTSGSLPLKAAPDIDGCTAPAAGTYTGRAALIKRGRCTFNDKAVNAQLAGATAVVLYNNVAAS
jgi:subtilisin family serine protease